jgi:hypothetical protein
LEVDSLSSNRFTVESKSIDGMTEKITHGMVEQERSSGREYQRGGRILVRG